MRHGICPSSSPGTISDASGRTLSGQTTEAFWNSIRHARPVVVGLNCALGGKQLRPYIEELARIADTFVCAYPNAGLPNAFGEYDESPEQTAAILGSSRERVPQHAGRLLRHDAGSHSRHGSPSGRHCTGQGAGHRARLPLSGLEPLTSMREGCS